MEVYLDQWPHHFRFTSYGPETCYYSLSNVVPGLEMVKHILGYKIIFWNPDSIIIMLLV